MNRKMSGVLCALLITVASLVSACATVGGGEECPISPDTVVKSMPAGTKDFPVSELPPPENEADKKYLGISGSGSFTVGHIKAQVVIIEVFSFYCPHCQRTAAQINDLYRLIEERPDLKGKVKLIGIGAKNSAFEVDAYRERYHVPFPLFPDEEMELTGKLGVKGTPTFIGVRMAEGKGVPRQFFFGEGGFEDNQKFLTEIIRLSGL